MTQPLTKETLMRKIVITAALTLTSAGIAMASSGSAPGRDASDEDDARDDSQTETRITLSISLPLAG
jgi:hypothetical protein